VVAAIITPPDVLSMTLLAVPMVLLYEIGVLVAAMLVRQKAARAAQHQDGDPR